MNTLICYRMNQQSKNTAGIFSKMIGQAAAFSELGQRVYVIYMNLDRIVLSEVNALGQITPVLDDGPIAKEGECDTFWQHAQGLIEQSGKSFDMVFCRYDMMFEKGRFVDFVAWNKRKKRHLVLEFPTYPYELEIQDETLRRIDAEHCSKLSQYVDLICSTAARDEILGIKNVFFDNKVFVDPQRISQSNASLVNQAGYFKLLMLANFKFWHGYDRLLRGLKTYVDAHPDAKIQCDFVGGGDELNKLQGLVSELSLQQWVTFHGFVPESHLSSFFSEASLGVASMGLHRIDIFQSSVLKVREYLSQGIPIAYANEDSDLEDFPWCFKVPQDESEVDIAALLDFLKSCDKQPRIRQEIRAFATEQLSWKGFAEQISTEVEATMGEQSELAP